MRSVSRNDPCPCGSGAKYKKCCLAKDETGGGVSPAATLEGAVELHRSGQLGAAERVYRQVLAREPRDAAALHLLGVARMQLGDYFKAIELIQRALALAGPQRDMLYNLGNALRGLRRDQAAVAVYLQALELSPDDETVHTNLGLTYSDLGQHSKAHDCYVRALKLAPDDVDLQINLGWSLANMHRVDEAIDQYRRTLARAPNHPGLCNNLGAALTNTGDIDGAIPLFEHALRLRPDYVEAHSNLIFCLDFVESGGAARQQEERRRWAQAHTSGIPRYTTWDNDRSSARKLRIGYVSGDFIGHSAVYAFAPLLFHCDRDAFDVVCYANSPAADDMTRRMRESVTAWRDIYALPDETVAELVRRDGIDILVDLSGHSGNNRLRVFARKPAPIQASGWGHANGTGLAEVDVLFADPIYIPPAEAGLYAERLYYLPCVLGYIANEQAPPVAPLPALANGHLTFGCFSRFAKIAAAALDLWCELLAALPDSRIVFKTAQLNSPSKRQWLVDQLAARGVAAARVDLVGFSPWREHMAAMGKVDIMLDTFPHGGGISTLDSLWMGVPVLAYERPIPTGRIAASILTATGLGDWIAASHDEFLALGRRRVADVAGLSDLRSRLRTQVRESPVGNPRRYAAAVEAAYRELWSDWCATRTPS